MEGSKIALQKHQTVKQKAPEWKKKKKHQMVFFINLVQ